MGVVPAGEMNDAAMKASSLFRWFTLWFVRYGLPVWLLRVVCKGLHEHASQTRGWINGAAMQAIQEAKMSGKKLDCEATVDGLRKEVGSFSFSVAKASGGRAGTCGGVLCV